MSKAVCVLYGSGVTLVLPQTYLISYLSFGATHLIVNMIIAHFKSKQHVESEFEAYLREKGLRSSKDN